MGEENKKCLVFIFNADSGAINSVKDFFHKMVKPSTYECNLCAVTFGNFGMKKEWAEYVSDLENEVNIEFLHRDEFEKYYPNVSDAKYPSAYIEQPYGLELFVSQAEMNNVESVEGLKNLVNRRLQKYI